MRRLVAANAGMVARLFSCMVSFTCVIQNGNITPRLTRTRMTAPFAHAVSSEWSLFAETKFQDHQYD